MTDRKYLPNITIHPILIFFIVISFLTGTFMELTIILGIVLWHELGHYWMAKFLNWNVEHVMLWAFGGVMKTEEYGYRSMKEDFLVTIAGPLQHVTIFLATAFLNVGHVVSEPVIQLVFFYNTVICLFNLLPIWPLDGGKLIHLVLMKLFPYKKAYDLTIVFSMIISVCALLLYVFLLPFNLSAFLIMFFILYENRVEWKERFYAFMRFLLYRYKDREVGVHPRIYPLRVHHHYFLMDVFKLFRRSYKHSIHVMDEQKRWHYFDEEECFNLYFDLKNHHLPLKAIIQKRE